MIQTAALIATAILLGLTVFQILLIAGYQLGNYAWGGQYRILPMRLRVASIVSVLFYGFFATIILEEAKLISIFASDALSATGIWVLVGYFFVGIFMNAISRSKPERMVMTPVAALLFALFLIVALSNP